MRRTLARAIHFSGRGLHSGKQADLAVHPAPAGHGIAFRRLDLGGAAPIPALWKHVVPGALNTRISLGGDNEVWTIEHLMAALAGFGITDALVTIDGPEVPILDGSARPFVEGILAAGLQDLPGELQVIEILSPVEVREGAAFARLSPALAPHMWFAIDFPDAAIGRQSRGLAMANGAVVEELADSRTFCRLADIERMREEGLALGGTYENAVVVDGARVLSPGGLRHADEAVRHKMLDAVGDLATAGAPVIGLYQGHRAGHMLTNRLLRALFARPETYRLRPASPEIAAHLPGTGMAAGDGAALRPRRVA